VKKTETNVRLMAETIVQREEAPDFNVEAFVRHYMAGEQYEPATEAEEEIQGYIEEALHNEFDRYNPSPKQAWEDNAPRITVKIGEKEFQTFIDEQGVQRFCGNSVITKIMDSPPLSDSHGILSLNTLVVNYLNGEFSSEDWLDFMTSFGYSVYGLCSLNAFTYLPVENPLWDEE
jgi:hypothetical protein